MKSSLRIPVVAVSAVLALGGLVACGDDKPADMTASQTAEFNQADVMFAQMMIPHHEQAVEMAKLAPTRAKDPKVKQLAAQIAGAQQPEIDTMTGWLSSWNQPMTGDHASMAETPGAMNTTTGDGMADAAAMAKLKAATGAAFDRQFLELMQVHHEGAIAMAKTEITDGKYPAAVALAHAVEEAQTKEVALIKQLLKS